MERLITDICQRIRERIPELETIDENYGQLVKMFEEGADADTYPVLSPACLVEARDVAWRNLAAPAQEGQATVVVTLAIDCYDDTHHDERNPQRERIARRLRLAERLHWALQGFKPAEATRLVRTATKLYHLPRLWKAYETTYAATILDTMPPPPHPPNSSGNREPYEREASRPPWGEGETGVLM